MIVLPSSSVPPQETAAPRSDVREVAALLGAELLEPRPAAGLFAPAQRQVRLDFTQARDAVRRHADAYLTWSERVAIPLAGLDRHTPRGALLHALDSPAKRALLKASGSTRRLRGAGVFAPRQLELATTELGLRDEQVSIVPYAADERFFAPAGDEVVEDYILAVGREQRDWPTLAAAVAPLGLRCVVVSSSPWSHRGAPGADNAEFERRSGVSFDELRALYAAARVVVVPLLPDVGYAAGLTTVREAQAMRRPVIVSNVPGLRGVIGEDAALAVEPADPGALRDAISSLLADEDAARAVADRGHAWTREHTFDGYVAQVAALVTG
jgi:glycosyltransferase involved in cell wall biosynthesis